MLFDTVRLTGIRRFWRLPTFAALRIIDGFQLCVFWEVYLCCSCAQ